MCLHGTTKQNSVVLQNCDPDVTPGTEVHVFKEAAACSCSLCKSSQASCEGLRYRGARRAPRDTSRLTATAPKPDDKSDGRAYGKTAQKAMGNNPGVSPEKGDLHSNRRFSPLPTRAKKSESLHGNLFDFDDDRNIREIKTAHSAHADNDVERDETGFRFLSKSLPIGAFGAGVLSSTVESDYDEPSVYSSVNDYFAKLNNSMHRLYDDNYNVNKINAFMNKYRTRIEQSIFDKYLSQKPLDNERYVSPDNMMKPVLEFKRKRPYEKIQSYFNYLR